MGNAGLFLQLLRIEDYVAVLMEVSFEKLYKSYMIIVIKKYNSSLLEKKDTLVSRIKKTKYYMTIRDGRVILIISRQLK